MIHDYKNVGCGSAMVYSHAGTCSSYLFFYLRLRDLQFQVLELSTLCSRRRIDTIFRYLLLQYYFVIRKFQVKHNYNIIVT